MKIDFEKINASIDLVELAGRYVPLKKVGKEFHGPCPVCGGSDRFFIFKEGRSCFCRGCRKSWDAIALVAEVGRIGMGDAARLISGDSFRASAPRALSSGVQECSVEVWREPEWQAAARDEIAKAERSLWGPSGLRVLEYLRGRGFSDEALKLFRIGASVSNGRSSALIPWIEGTGLILAVKYRFLEESELSSKRLRFVQKAGSCSALFGLHTLRGGADNRVLIATEGEFNAMSAWQAMEGCCDIVSLGSQSNSFGLDLLCRLVERIGYGRLVIWLDEPERVRAVGELIRAPAGLRLTCIASPRGMDANDILRLHGSHGLAQIIGSR